MSPLSFKNHRGQRTDLASEPQIRGWPITQKVSRVQTSHLACTIKPCFSYSLTIWTTYGRKLLQETTKMINIIRQYASTSGKSTSIVGLCLLLNTAFIISHLELTTCISVDILEFILKYPEKEVDFDVCFQI